MLAGWELALGHSSWPDCGGSLSSPNAAVGNLERQRTDLHAGTLDRRVGAPAGGVGEGEFDREPVRAFEACFGLKILVLVVRFRPWPPTSISFSTFLFPASGALRPRVASARSAGHVSPRRSSKCS